MVTGPRIGRKRASEKVAHALRHSRFHGPATAWHGRKKEDDMSYPYPQDRRREQREKGDQPYTDAREAMSRQDAELQAQAEGYGEARNAETEEERRTHVEDEAKEHLKEIGDEVARKSKRGG
jgi:hypothetical protein